MQHGTQGASATRAEVSAQRSADPSPSTCAPASRLSLSHRGAIKPGQRAHACWWYRPSLVPSNGSLLRVLGELAAGRAGLGQLAAHPEALAQIDRRLERLARGSLVVPQQRDLRAQALDLPHPPAVLDLRGCAVVGVEGYCGAVEVATLEVESRQLDAVPDD